MPLLKKSDFSLIPFNKFVEYNSNLYFCRKILNDLAMGVAGRGVFLLMGVTIFGQADAQRTCVVADMENHVPIKEAVIHTNTGHWARTDYRGYFAMKYAFDSAKVSKPGYIPVTIHLAALPDTVFLLPAAHQIGEVEVWGENQHNVSVFEKDAGNAARTVPRPGGIQGDFLGWMDRRAVRDRKHYRKAKKIIAELDKETGDPIVDTYLQQKRADEERKLQAAEQEKAKKECEAAKLDDLKAREEAKIANQ